MIWIKIVHSKCFSASLLNAFQAQRRSLKQPKLILEECEKAGVLATIEPFEIDQPKVYEASIAVTQPVQETFYCTGLGKAGKPLPKESRLLWFTFMMEMMKILPM